MEQQPTQNALAQTPPPEPPGYESRNVEQIISPQVKKNPENIYSATYSSIIIKNFLAGFFRGLGGVFVYLIFLFIGFIFFKNYILPEISPMLESMEKLTKLAEQQTQNPSTSIQVTPEMLQLFEETSR